MNVAPPRVWPSRLLLPLVAASFFAGCARQTPSSGTPRTTTGAVAASPFFVDVAASSGIGAWKWEPLGKRPLTILQTIGNGCGFVDYDGDGNLDIVLVGKTIGLFRGDGKGNFADVSASTGVGNLRGYFLGVASGDYDNDGFVDLYITGYRDGRLLRNDGGKRFVDVTKSVGLTPQDWGTSASFTDVDGDGFLDLFVANYADFGPKTRPQLCFFPTADRTGRVLSSCGPRFYQPIRASLFQNAGGKRFVDITKASGANAHAGKGLGVASADFDGSGREGIAVANDETDGNLFVSGGEGKVGGGAKIKDIAVEAGVARDREGMVHAGMGIDWGDSNNDGRLDLVVTTFRNEAKSLYRNDGDRLFTDISFPSGVGRAAFPYVAFGVKFLDADNDGALDLMIANGHVQDNIERLEDTTYRQPIVFLHNNGAGLYDEKSAASGVAAVGNIVGRGLAVGDYDNDGRIDCLVVDAEGRPVLLHNETKTAGRFVTLSLVGVAKNRSAHGAIVTVQTPDGKKFVRHCQSDGSYMSVSDARVSIGVGSADRVDLTVRWPGGSVQTLRNLETGTFWRVTEGKPAVK